MFLVGGSQWEGSEGSMWVEGRGGEWVILSWAVGHCRQCVGGLRLRDRHVLLGVQ